MYLCPKLSGVNTSKGLSLHFTKFIRFLLIDAYTGWFFMPFTQQKRFNYYLICEMGHFIPFTIAKREKQFPFALAMRQTTII
jgi:hypothetical protein